MSNQLVLTQADEQRSRGAEGKMPSPLLLRSSAPLLIILIALTLLQLACGRAPDLETPPEILYGEEVCTECGMIISDPRFAAAYVTTTGEARLFDDVGDMLAYDQRHHEAVHAYWVNDFHTEQWLRAEQAALVMQSDLHTPMGWGLAAFSTAAEAQAYVDTHGGLVTTLANLQTAVGDGLLQP